MTYWQKEQKNKKTELLVEIKDLIKRAKIKIKYSQKANKLLKQAKISCLELLKIPEDVVEKMHFKRIQDEIRSLMRESEKKQSIKKEEKKARTHSKESRILKICMEVLQRRLLKVSKYNKLTIIGVSNPPKDFITRTRIKVVCRLIKKNNSLEPNLTVFHQIDDRENNIDNHELNWTTVGVSSAKGVQIYKEIMQRIKEEFISKNNTNDGWDAEPEVNEDQ